MIVQRDLRALTDLDLLLLAPPSTPSSRALVDHFGGLRALLTARRPELVAAGLSPALARRITAIRRVARALIRARRRRRLTSARRVARMVPHLAWHPVEELWVLPCDAGLRTLGCTMVARGGASSCAASPAEILAPVLRVRASGFFVVHNHPSGDPTPSPADVDFTERLRQASRLMALRLEDHLVIAGGRFASIVTRRRGALERTSGRPRLLLGEARASPAY